MSTEELVRNAQDTAALSESYWTHGQLGGWFEVLLVVKGEGGLAKDAQVVVYRRVGTHEVYARSLHNWQLTMIPADLEQPHKHWQD